jgi:hypothetical protein
MGHELASDNTRSANEVTRMRALCYRVSVRTPDPVKHATHFEKIPVALVKKLLQQKRAAERATRRTGRHNSRSRLPKGHTFAGKSR